MLGTRFKLENSDDDVAIIKRKRTRGGPSWNSRYSAVPEDDVPIPVPMTHCNQLRIGNTEEVAKFYAQRFKDLQQSACKVVAKAFVKAIEPKKQTNYPYTKGLERAPPWWPPMPSGGEKQEKCVRHKEPDHLYKKGRMIPIGLPRWRSNSDYRTSPVAGPYPATGHKSGSGKASEYKKY